MRRGEALGLQWGDIDTKAQRLSIRRSADSATRGKTKLPKSGKARVIDLDKKLLTALSELRKVKAQISFDLARRDAYIFGDDNGNLRNPKRVTDMWARRVTRAPKELGGDPFPYLSIHGLRHSHATILMSLGESPKIVQERLGHASISITIDLYQHVTQTMQRGAVDKFAALF